MRGPGVSVLIRMVALRAMIVALILPLAGAPPQTGQWKRRLGVGKR